MVVCCPCCLAADVTQLSIATRQLLQGRTSAGARSAEAGGASGPRQFSTVAQHKTPQAPRLTRKNFERKMP
jgi:hypothetical protein